MVRGYVDDAIDGFSGNQEVISFAHHEIHAGDGFVVCSTATLGNGGTRTVTFTTPIEGEMHLLISARASKEAHLELIEDVIVSTSSGFYQLAQNRNRNSSNVSKASNVVDGSVALGSVAIDATLSMAGVVIFEEHFGSGQKAGGEVRDNNEWNLKTGGQYQVKMESEAVSNDTQICLNWYEHRRSLE